MSNQKIKYFVKINAERPDYRRIVSFLWSDLQNVNSDGNSYNPASREWTELTLENREPPHESVDIDPIQKEPLILAVKSKRRDIVARTTYILAKETNGKVAIKLEGEFVDYEFLEQEMGSFDLQKALNRFENSMFANSTLENPYPFI